jgi:hypothetical protein
MPLPRGVECNGLVSTVIITLMSGDSKFSYGDQVQVKDGKHKDRLADVVGMTLTASSRTYTVEFGGGSDAEIEEGLLSRVDE